MHAHRRQNTKYPSEHASKLLHFHSYCYPHQLAKLYLVRQLTHLGVSSLLELSDQLQINSPPALTRNEQTLVFSILSLRRPNCKSSLSLRISMPTEMDGRMHRGSRGEGERTRPWSQLFALHIKAEQSILWGWWKESIAKTHLDWTTPLITRKAAKEKQKFTGRKKRQRNSHKEAEFHSTGSKPEYYKKTTELTAIKENQTKTSSLVSPETNVTSPPSLPFPAQLFFPLFLFSWKEKVPTELRGQKDA